ARRASSTPTLTQASATFWAIEGLSPRNCLGRCRLPPRSRRRPALRWSCSEAAGAAGASSKPPAIGRVSNLAKSFSLTAEPAVFDGLARHPRIKSILPSEIADIYPKPTKVVRDPPGDLN